MGQVALGGHGGLGESVVRNEEGSTAPARGAEPIGNPGNRQGGEDCWAIDGLTSMPAGFPHAVSANSPGDAGSK
jgi:hypothetical protein